MLRASGLVGLMGIALVPGVNAEVVFETSRSRIVLNDDATWASVVEVASGRECLAPDSGLPVATVRHGDDTYVASSLVASEAGLVLGFADTDTRLHYAVEVADDWVVFRLQEIEGARPEAVVLLQAPISITERVGSRLNIAWDDETAVCLMAATRQADCRARRKKTYALLAASSQDAPGPRLEGSSVAIIVCPTDEFKAIAREASHAFGLLTNEDADGTPAKDTELVRGSYWFMGFGEADVDRVVDYCEQAGIRQVMLSSGAWCRGPGHYILNERYFPGGLESLRATVQRLHEHDILVGAHCFVSKVSKRDPYVTPAPDPRFLTDMQDALAGEITAEQTEIRVAGDLSRWAGCPVVADRYWEGGVTKHQEVILGDEIVRYEAIGPEGVWDTFLGCARGSWGTTSAAHSAGAPARHFGVDGCINGYIIDQETDLMDEVADRFAAIFNACEFDMIYFDGGEDVDRRRYRYYVSNFQEQAVKRITRRPLIHMGTAMTHLLWHSFARSSTVDQYLNTLSGAIVGGKPPAQWPTVKEHIDRSVRYMVSVQQDMMPGELGWFGIWPRGQRRYTARLKPGEDEKYREMGAADGPVELPTRNGRMIARLVSAEALDVIVEYDGLQLDEIEYLMAKSLGWDAPVSLQTSFKSMDAHVLTPEILRIVRTYEDLRIARAVPEATRERLRETGRDFAIVRWQGETSWAEVEPITRSDDNPDLRALVGSFAEGSVATLWHTTREGQLLLPMPATALTLISLGGDEIAFEAEDGQALVPVGQTRNTLVCPTLPRDQLREAIENGELRLREATTITVCAADFDRIEGKIALGATVGVNDPDVAGDFLVPTAGASPAALQEWFAEYTVEIPHDGLWTFWGHMRYPRGGDDSFGLVFDREELTLSGDQVLGNCGVNADRWHWAGRGGGSTSIPPGTPITRRLPAGPLTFRLYARESSNDPQTAPRFEQMHISDDPLAVPGGTAGNGE